MPGGDRRLRQGPTEAVEHPVMSQVDMVCDDPTFDLAAERERRRVAYFEKSLTRALVEALLELADGFGCARCPRHAGREISARHRQRHRVGPRGVPALRDVGIVGEIVSSTWSYHECPLLL